MNNSPVYEITKSGKELKLIGWAGSLVHATRIASAFGHSRGDWRSDFHGSLGEGYGIAPKVHVAEV